MDLKELRKKPMEELEKMRETLETEVGDAYFEMRTGKLKNVRKPKMLRRNLAKVQTIIQEKTKGQDKISGEENE